LSNIVITGPDGKEYVFPAGTQREQMLAVMRRQYLPPQDARRTREGRDMIMNSQLDTPEVADVRQYVARQELGQSLDQGRQQMRADEMAGPRDPGKERFYTAAQGLTLGAAPYLQGGLTGAAGAMGWPLMDDEARMGRSYPEFVSEMASRGYNSARTHIDRGREERPMESLGIELAGGLLTGKTAYDALAQGALAGRAGAAGGVAGAGAGAQYGLLDSEGDAGDTLAGAALGGSFGASLAKGFQALSRGGATGVPPAVRTDYLEPSDIYTEGLTRNLEANIIEGSQLPRVAERMEKAQTLDDAWGAIASYSDSQIIPLNEMIRPDPKKLDLAFRVPERFHEEIAKRYLQKYPQEWRQLWDIWPSGGSTPLQSDRANYRPFIKLVKDYAPEYEFQVAQVGDEVAEMLMDPLRARASELTPMSEQARPNIFDRRNLNRIDRPANDTSPGGLFHGTPGKIEGPLRPSDDGLFGPGVYMTPDRSRAGAYAGEAGEVVESGVTGNLAKYSDWQNATREASKGVRPGPGAQADIQKRAIEALEAEGFVGVEAGDTVTVWKPENLTPAKAVEQAKQSGYQGADTGESAEWLSAVQKGLPMDTPARMARADEQGYTIDAFRGLRVAPRAGNVPDDQMIGGGWFSDSADTAEGYARDVPLSRNKGLMMKTRLRLENPLTIDAGGRMFDRVPASAIGDLADGKKPVYTTQEVADLAREAGYDGVQFNNIKADRQSSRNTKPGTIWAVFDAGNVRSANAAFDPDKAGSPTLLAGFGDDLLTAGMGGAAVATGMMAMTPGGGREMLEDSEPAPEPQQPNPNAPINAVSRIGREAPPLPALSPENADDPATFGLESFDDLAADDPLRDPWFRGAIIQRAIVDRQYREYARQMEQR
jgi:hypothetical protein